MAVPVLVQQVKAYRFEEQIEATGQLLAPAQASVAAMVDGQVTRVALDEGSAANLGEAVIEIDPQRRELELRTRRAAEAEAESNLGERVRDLGRISQLKERGAVSESQLDAVRTAADLARSRRDGAVAQRELAERALRDSTVRAPFSGLVARRFVSAGEFVSPGKPLFELVALDPIEVEFFLPEKDASRVALGVPVGVKVAPFPDERFAATVTVVSPTIDSVTRTLRVKASLPNKDGRLRPGLFARAELGVSQRENVVMVPEEAVLQRSDGAVVFRLPPNSQDRVERRVVTTGVIRGGLVEIVSGIDAGDQVVVRGQTDLIDGSVVSLRGSEGQPQSAATSAESAASQLAGEPQS
jgi:membrane fusion protein (multidrug efflux system)